MTLITQPANIRLASAPPVGLWTPADIPTALWLDASDASTVTVESGAVSEWRDKSGNSRNATQGTAANRPAYTSAGQNGLNVLTLDGSNDSMALGSDLSLGTVHTVIVAAKNSSTITTATSSQMLLSGGAYVSSSTSEWVFGAGSLTGNLTDERLYSLVIADSSGAASVFGYGKTNADVSGGLIVSESFTTTGNAFTGRLNGSADYATASIAGGFSSTSARYPTVARGIGYRYSNNASFWNGQIWEIVLTASALSLSDTQRIEGYLAHKWGLTANLPANHPYKATPPYTPRGLAVGGDFTYDILSNGTTYRVHEFRSTNPSTLTVLSPIQAQYLVVGGGGGGGQGFGAGGGAGGYRDGTLSISPGVLSIGVGSGGIGATTSNTVGAPGISSYLGSIIAAGGGYGGAAGNFGTAQPGGNGGSGGGGGASPTNGAGGLGNIPATVPSQGNNGAAGLSGTYGGGGGGAGSAGSTKNGGSGKYSAITGASVGRAGGGAGNSTTGHGTASEGGGGNVGGVIMPAAANTGGGGIGDPVQSTASGGSGIVIVRYPVVSGSPVTYDRDAQVYITAVETADGQALEDSVRNAINTFVVGCKADGIWNSIKASCILAGARTLSGALVPLVGTAPTNFNFVSGDYNRKTGLLGNGSTKYLNSNRANNSDPQNSKHLSVYASTAGTSGIHIGANGNIEYSYISTVATVNAVSTDNVTISAFYYTGFGGADRSVSSQFTGRANGTTVTKTATSQATSTRPLYVFARNNDGTTSNYSNARLAFYSIGESLNLALLDSRVSTLISALAAAIP